MAETQLSESEPDARTTVRIPAGTATDEPHVTCVREGEVVREIHVRCACGREIQLRCEY